MEPLSIITVIAIIVPLAIKTYYFFDGLVEKHKADKLKQLAADQLAQTDKTIETKIEEMKNKIEVEKDTTVADTHKLVGEIDDVFDAISAFATSAPVKEGFKEVKSMANEIAVIQQDRAVEQQQEQINRLIVNQNQPATNNTIVNSTSPVDNGEQMKLLQLQIALLIQQMAMQQLMMQKFMAASAIMSQQPGMQDLGYKDFTSEGNPKHGESDIELAGNHFNNHLIEATA